MSFLRRFLGRATPAPASEPPSRAWFDLPPGGSFEIAGVGHHREELAQLFPPTAGEPDRVSAVAVLVREPDNPHDSYAVAVLIEGRRVGYIPADTAPDWADFLGRLDDEGYRCRATASVWVGEHAWFVRLLAHEDADYLTPVEAAEAAREKAEASAAKEGARAARAATRAALLVDRQRGREIPPADRAAAVPAAPPGSPPAEPSAKAAPAPVAGPTTPGATAPTTQLRRIPWTPIVRPAAWAVLDVETTGIYPNVDRIVEIAVLRVDPDGNEIDAWTTMLDPARDMGAVEIHGVRASDVRGAPTFPDIVPELLARLSGARIAAHNARFDIDFVDAGLRRAGIGWEKPDAFCTMATPYRLGLLGSRRLNACCGQLGIPYERAHTALSDARAAAAILAFTMERVGSISLPTPAPAWPDPAWTVPARLRTDPPPPRIDTSLGQLADRVGLPAGVDASDDAALAYLSLLDRVVEDRVVTEPEIAALAETARSWGIGAITATRLHRSYMAAMWELASADGVITANERHDLRLLSELLGVPADSDLAGPPPLVLPRADSLTGLSVCFTGGSVCTIGGAKLTREDQEQLAASRGLVIKTGVSKQLDLLVLADPDSRSGKAQRAAELGVRRMAEPAFWRAVGVEID